MKFSNAAPRLVATSLGLAMLSNPNGLLAEGTHPGSTRRTTPALSPQAHAATISPSLQAKLAALPSAATVVPGTVIVVFDTATGLAGVDLDTPVTGLLARYGITVGHRFTNLGMISARLTGAQITALTADPAVLSIGANDRLYYNMHQARVLCGVDKLRADANMTAQHGGQVIDGTPAPGGAQFSVAVIDSGIDTTNTDLPFDMATSIAGTVPTKGKVIQNVQVNGDDAVGTVSYTENLPNTDSVAHGTHCAGIIGNTGAFSRTNAATAGPGAGTMENFSGVAGQFTGSSATDITNMATASGVKIVGLGSGAGLFVLDALGGFEYTIANQVKYNIRITSNSYGSIGTYDPNDSLSVAIKNAYAHNQTTVFAAGNSGPGVNTISSNSKSPYVITVAAGTKEGGLASFSSRGLPANQRGTAGDTAGSNQYNFPAITAPGTGREFLFDGPYDPAATSPFVAGATAANPDTVGKKFYSDIISTLAKTGTAARGTNDQEFPAPYQATYTMISGTSMACPFTAGTCALLLSVNPSLTPDQIKSILQATATHMPDYQDYEVGAGYINDYAAVDLALNPNKPYLTFNRIDAPYSSSYPAFITKITNTLIAPPARPTGYPPLTAMGTATSGEDFSLPYNPNSVSAADYAAAKTKALTNNNAYAFTVDAGPDGTPTPNLSATLKTTLLDARIQFGNASAASVAGGNSIGMLLWAPDGTFYSSGIALPVLDDPSRQVVVRNPQAGLWVLELRGLRGLAAVPITPPTGLGLPDTTTGQIYRTNALITNPPSDINGIPQSDSITFALLNRYLDEVTSDLFKPQTSVTRGDFVQVIADNMPLRQSLRGTTSPYTDTTSAYQARYAEAAAQYGSTLRDWDFTPGPTLPTNSTTFTPNSYISRMQAAVAMIRALGLDAEAQKLAGTNVQVSVNGTLTAISDARVIDPAQRGYLQLALNRGLISYIIDFQGRVIATPTKSLTRADLATAIVNFRTIFRAGNTLATTELNPQ